MLSYGGLEVLWFGLGGDRAACYTQLPVSMVVRWLVLQAVFGLVWDTIWRGDRGLDITDWKR